MRDLLSVVRKFVVGASLLGLATLAFSASPASGQATTGNLAGAIKDATGAAVPNASIVLTSESTGVSVSGTSNSSGDFLFQNLQPASYDLKVTAASFAPSLIKGIHVELNSTATANVPLSLGSQSTTVEVQSDASALLDTTTTNLATTFSNVEMSDFPTTSVGLGVLNASLLSPGVASTGGVGIGVGPSVGGQRPRNNNFEIEGIDNNNKAVTGPLVYLPNDAVGSFTLITNQFSPEFGHSSGGQFNTTTVSGTNKFHGKAYEYFQNRNLNAESGIQGGKIANPRYDNNRYGGQLGGPIFKDKLFFFGNYERNTIGQSQSYYLCTPTSAGLTTLNGLASSYGFSANNLTQYTKYVPAANAFGGAQVTGGSSGNDNACFNQTSGLQTLTVTNSQTGGKGTASTPIPLGNYLVSSPVFSNQSNVTAAVDYTINSKDTIRGRYIYNTLGSQDVAAALPIFFTTQPNTFHLLALSEFHSFTPNLVNELRIGFNRYANVIGAGNFTFPGLDSFPTFSIDSDQNFLSIGPDGNAPQFTIQNLYQVTDNVSYTKGAHTIKLGFDGRKYISPQGFTQRARGDYEYGTLDVYLHDLAPDDFAERSSGNHTYYGDQTALYGYVNDTYRATPTLTINAGLRYEFTSVPVGERSQGLNSAASVAGLINIGVPQPTYTSFAPRFGINYAPDNKTSIRAGFGIAYDVLFDNLGTLSFPPQYSSTEDVGSPCPPPAGSPAGTPPSTTTCSGFPVFLSPNFLKNGGLPAGASGTFAYPSTPAGLAQQRAATSAFVPNQVTPYAETYTLNIQRTFGVNYTAQLGYTGTRGIHLATQVQINKQPKATAANQLFTVANGGTTIAPAGGTSTLSQINALSAVLPAYAAAGFTSTITSYQPFSQSNYNGLLANLTRRFQNGLQMDLSYTWSKTMDDATAEVFATVLTPRRQQDSQCISCDYSRSALDRTHRISFEVLYDLPYYKHSKSFLLKNVVGNWEISPIYTYESPEYTTVLSGVNSNLNGDSGTAIDRAFINPNGVKGTSTKSTAVVNPALAASCVGSTTATPASNGDGSGLYLACPTDIVGYSAGVVNSTDPINGIVLNGAGTRYVNGAFAASNAYYVQAGLGTSPNASRNTLPVRPIDNFDITAFKRFTIYEHYSLEFGAQAFNVLNHAQYLPGTVDNVNATSYTASYNFQTVGSGAFNHPEKIFGNNARTMQLVGKITF